MRTLVDGGVGNGNLRWRKAPLESNLEKDSANADMPYRTCPKVKPKVIILHYPTEYAERCSLNLLPPVRLV